MTSDDKTTLLDIYTKAAENLEKIIKEKEAKGNVTKFQNNMLAEVNAEIARLQKEAESWTITNVKEAYETGESLANLASNKPYVISESARAATSVRSISYITGDIIARVSVANDSLAKKLKSVIKQDVLTGQTVRDTQKRIIDSIYGATGQNTININGKEWDMRKYSEMVGRTARREAENTAAVNIAKAQGTDFIYIVPHSPTCKACGQKQDRVYSISGKSKEYPPLEAAWGADGYSTIHPGCQCTTRPYHPDDRSDEEKERILERSQEPLDSDNRTQKSIDAYNASQRRKTQLWNDKKQYLRHKETLGEENVPKSFSAFRKRKYSNNTEWKVQEAQYKGMNYYNKAIANEPSITNTVKNVASKVDMKPAGLEYRIKSKESYLRKIKTKYNEKGNDFEINDIIRYTYVDEPEVLASKTLNSIEEYGKMGYNTVEVKNSWIDPSNPYKGVNTTISSPNGQKFELQYHTPEGLIKKEEIHPYYEEWRLLPDGTDEKDRLMDQMHEITADLVPPKDIEKVR